MMQPRNILNALMINPYAWFNARRNSHVPHVVWCMTLYSIPVLARGLQQKKGNTETIVCCNVVGKEKSVLADKCCLRLCTDSESTTQKRFTHRAKTETVTCSSQGKPTLVFMEIFSLVDHKLSGGGFGWGYETLCMYVCECVFQCDYLQDSFFPILTLTLISV